MSKVNPLILTVRVGIPAKMEAEFNEWYNHIHIPETMKCPGWLSARRFEAVEGEPKFLGIYEMEDLGARQTKEFLRVRGWSKFEPYISDWKSTVYRQIYPVITE